MQYYISKLSGKIITKADVLGFISIVGDNDTKYSEIIDKFVVPIDTPTVIDCLLHDSRVSAYHRYREIHPKKTVTETFAMLALIEDDIKRYRKKNNKND